MSRIRDVSAGPAGAPRCRRCRRGHIEARRDPVRPTHVPAEQRVDADHTRYRKPVLRRRMAGAALSAPFATLRIPKSRRRDRSEQRVRDSRSHARTLELSAATSLALERFARNPSPSLRASPQSHSVRHRESRTTGRSSIFAVPCGRTDVTQDPSLRKRSPIMGSEGRSSCSTRRT